MWRSSIILLAFTALTWGTPRLALAQDLGDGIDAVAASEPTAGLEESGQGAPSNDIREAADEALKEEPKGTPEPMDTMKPAYGHSHQPKATHAAAASSKKGKKKKAAKPKRAAASVSKHSKKKVGGKTSKKKAKKKSSKKKKH